MFFFLFDVMVYIFKWLKIDPGISQNHVHTLTQRRCLSFLACVCSHFQLFGLFYTVSPFLFPFISRLFCLRDDFWLDGCLFVWLLVETCVFYSFGGGQYISYHPHWKARNLFHVVPYCNPWKSFEKFFRAYPQTALLIFVYNVGIWFDKISIYATLFCFCFFFYFCIY